MISRMDRAGFVSDRVFDSVSDLHSQRDARQDSQPIARQAHSAHYVPYRGRDTSSINPKNRDRPAREFFTLRRHDDNSDVDAKASVGGSHHAFEAYPNFSSHDKENNHLHKRSLKKNATQELSSTATRTTPDSPLFEPMDDGPLEVDPATIDDSSSTPADMVKANMKPDGLKRARTIKAEIENNISILKSTKPTKKNVVEDPENQLIKTLRQDHKMEWTAIANFLNEERLKRGEPPNMTQPAVYSRFVRNAPRIAAAQGEVGFDPKDYMHLRHPHHYPNSELGTLIGAPKKRGQDGAKELHGNIRKRSKLADESAELERSDKTTMVIEAVATIERNFWTFVADELERTSGKLYDPKAIAGRYHSV